VAVASGIAEDLVRSFDIPQERIVVIHNPIDIEAVRRRAEEAVSHPWFMEHNTPIVVAVGRLTKLKGFHHLIEAMAHLPCAARLAIIGDGEEYRALEQRIIELNLTDRVALLGYQDNPWKYMARADLFVLSSLTEGWPNVIGEAMALGVPIVATDCSPGVREVLEEGKSGLLVPAGDPEALAKGIARVLGDEALRKELARRGRERVAQFDLPKVVMLYEDVLLRLLHKDRHS
jgi:glycosyltransferase involved in cell wall biosynthesis